MARLGDVCDILNGFAFKSEQYVDDGIRIIRIANVQKGYIEDSAPAFYPIDSKDAKKYSLEEGDILMSLTGNVGRVAKLTKEFLPAALNQRVACLRIKDGVALDKAFLFNLLNADYFEQQCIAASKGVAQKNMSTEWLKEYEIPMFSLGQQKVIASVLDKVTELVSMRKEQLAKLDELVKARFVEMFGDPEHNEKAIPALPMTELCEIIDGDRGANYPKQEEFSDNGFCLFLNAKNVTANGFSFENCMFITAEKDERLRKGKLSRGDVVLTTRGTIGNLAFYDGAVPYEHIRINSGMVILRMKRERITERFFIEQFKMQLASIKEKIASGSAQPQLPISTMNKILMLVPDVELQAQFASFVEQTNKTKLTTQASLDKLEVMKKALMQEYFG